MAKKGIWLCLVIRFFANGKIGKTFQVVNATPCKVKATRISASAAMNIGGSVLSVGNESPFAQSSTCAKYA